MPYIAWFPVKHDMVKAGPSRNRLLFIIGIGDLKSPKFDAVSPSGSLRDKPRFPLFITFFPMQHTTNFNAIVDNIK